MISDPRSIFEIGWSFQILLLTMSYYNMEMRLEMPKNIVVQNLLDFPPPTEKSYNILAIRP